MAKIERQSYKFLLASFGIFGFSALILQVVFAKNLVLLFGLTAPAIATVLAVYFSGLALGGFFFGRLADKLSSRKIHWLYISFFILTGIYGFLFPFLFKLLNIFIQSVNQIYPLSFSGFNFVAFLLAFLFLIFPAILIGGGFPVINKILIRQKKGLGKKVSLIYFVETFGSVLGAAAAGFWLIPSLGNNTTIFLAAGLNMVVGIAIFLLIKQKIFYVSKDLPSSQQSSEALLRPSVAEGEGGAKEGQTKTIQNPLFLYALFATGFLALALEVLYTKTLILFIGSSTYAFSLILIIFLLGIALGSWVASFSLAR